MFGSEGIVEEVSRLLVKHTALETAVARIKSKQEELEGKRVALIDRASGMRTQLSVLMFDLPVGSDDETVNGAITAVIDVLERYEALPVVDVV